MKNIILVSIFALLLSATSLAQSPCSGSSAPSGSKTSSQSASPSPTTTAPAATVQTQDQNPPDQSQNDKKKKDKKKKKKDKGSADDVTVPTSFSDAVAQDVIQQLTDGLEGHSERLMLSTFDDNKMDGYLNFEDQIEAFFQKYDSFRVHFRIAQATTEGDKGVVLVDIEMEEIPRSASSQPVRKRDQMRFEMERGKKGWKIVDLRPRTFFS
jgi:hypothetical protein